jgi:hypothetical protein
MACIISRVTSCLLCPKKTSLNRDPLAVVPFLEDETPLVSLTIPFLTIAPFDSRGSGD